MHDPQGKPLPIALNKQLRMEPHWSYVETGLGKILMGNFVFIGGCVIAAAFIMVAIFGWPEPDTTNFRGMPPPPSASSGKASGDIIKLWCGGAAVGVLIVASLLSYLMVITGMVGCMLGAAERHSARWYMFVCCVTIIVIPILNILTYIGGTAVYPDLSDGLDSIERARLSAFGFYMSVAASLATIGTSISFGLFLRAVSICMGSPSHIKLAQGYLSFICPLLAATFYVTFIERSLLPTYAIPLAIATLIGGGYHLVAVAATRGCVEDRMKRIRENVEVETYYNNLAPMGS